MNDLIDLVKQYMEQGLTDTEIILAVERDMDTLDRLGK